LPSPHLRRVYIRWACPAHTSAEFISAGLAQPIKKTR